MRRRKVSSITILVALAALLSLGGLLFEESFVHTDDGCAVEVHCLACRLTLGGSAVLAASLDVAPVTTEVALETPVAPVVPERVAPRLLRSRAPPLA
jgi:branched-subunit amino acid permease